MNARIILLPLSLLVMVFCCCCFASELVPVYVEKDPVELASGYSLGRPSLSGLKLYGKAYKCYDDPSATCYPTIIEPSVVKIGWNDRFIIGERHPLDNVIFSTPDAMNPSWFIIVLQSDTISIDLSQEEFNSMLETMQISNLEMEDAMDVYKQK